MAEQTKKRSMTTDEETETETEVRSKNTSAVTAYRCCERQRNENFRDYNFKDMFFTLTLHLSVASKSCRTRNLIFNEKNGTTLCFHSQIGSIATYN